MNKCIKRIYHKCDLWEEIKHNMWGEVKNKAKYLEKAITFTGDHKKYGRFMLKVAKEWKYSCENALTDNILNRKAWIGHAACALYGGIPENIVRSAWGKLTDEQRLLANKEAEKAIQAWEYSYIKDNELYNDMGESMLFGWDSRRNKR